MASVRINRDARVLTEEGEVGHVEHIVVDPDTREVTDVVVEQDGEQWLIPVTAVTDIGDDTVMLAGSWAQYRAANRFDRERFRPVDDVEAREETEQRALHGGRPLLDAEEESVEVGGQRESALAAPHAESRPARPGGEGNYRLELREEQLHVHKEEAEAGTVTIGKRVTEHTEAVDVPVREEQVVIERRPVAGEPAAGRTIGDDEVIEVPVMRERVTVEKEAVVAEEIIVRKEATEHTEHIEETVRREEPVIHDPTGRVAGASELATDDRHGTPARNV